MITSSVRSAGIALLLLTVNGCGQVGGSADTGARSPGINVAEAALQGGSGQIALQVSDGILRNSPSDVRALGVKGDALVLLGEYEDATKIYDALLAKDPNSIRATIGLGRIRLSKDPAAAAALFEQVLKREPRDLTALNNLGIARDLQNRHAEAQVHYRQALAISPELESAQVNLALSMAMSGQGAAAVKMLQAKATQPGAAVKVRHDYAVVLAMAGNRREAERVLREDMSPDEAREMVDRATGTRTKPIADPAAAQIASARQVDDSIPPDVVQVPEITPPASRPSGRMAVAAPPPAVVRPMRSTEPDTSTPPAVQPVNPVAAAIMNQKPLALPIRASDGLAQDTPAPTIVVSPVPDAAPLPAVITPKVVAMPPMLPLPRVLPMPSPEPSADVAAPAPSSPRSSQVGSYKPYVAPEQAASIPAGTEPPPPPATAAARPAPASAPSPRVEAQPKASVVAMLSPPRTPEARVASVRDSLATPQRDGGLPTVQFAASPTEQAARAFWQGLVHRFPDILGQRQATVVRFERGGTVFWRVRTEGFGTVSDAQSLCSRMRASGQNCFVPRS